VSRRRLPVVGVDDPSTNPVSCGTEQLGNPAVYLPRCGSVARIRIRWQPMIVPDGSSGRVGSERIPGLYRMKLDLVGRVRLLRHLQTALNSTTNHIGRRSDSRAVMPSSRGVENDDTSKLEFRTSGWRDCSASGALCHCGWCRLRPPIAKLGRPADVAAGLIDSFSNKLHRRQADRRSAFANWWRRSRRNSKPEAAVRYDTTTCRVPCHPSWCEVHADPELAFRATAGRGFRRQVQPRTERQGRHFSRQQS